MQYRRFKVGRSIRTVKDFQATMLGRDNGASLLVKMGPSKDSL